MSYISMYQGIVPCEVYKDVTPQEAPRTGIPSCAGILIIGDNRSHISARGLYGVCIAYALSNSWMSLHLISTTIPSLFSKY